jgi:hypothetical protein
MDTNDNLLPEEFEKNLHQQELVFEHYFVEHERQNKFPVNEYANREFWYHYWHFHACLASLRSNPDTKDDEDFVFLCEQLKELLRFPYVFRLSKSDFKEAEKQYYRINEKPAFKNNRFYNEIFGDFVKGIYSLITDAFPDYWKGFFELD